MNIFMESKILKSMIINVQNMKEIMIFKKLQKSQKDQYPSPLVLQPLKQKIQ